MFFKSYRFHLLKLGLGKANVILISIFMVVTILIMILMKIFAVHQNSTILIYGFTSVEFLTVFFISISNLFLSYSIIKKSNSTKIESLEKQSGLKHWEMFLTRTLANKTITTSYITFIIIAWIITISIVRLDNYLIILNIITPGLCFLYFYDLLFYGFVSFGIILGHKILVFIFGTISAGVVSFIPLLMSIPIEGLTGTEVNHDDVPIVYGRIALNSYFLLQNKSGLINNLVTKNSEEGYSFIIRLTQEGESIESSKFQEYFKTINNEAFWYKSGMFSNYLQSLNNSAKKVFPEIVDFDVFKFTSEFENSFQFNLYNILVDVLRELNFKISYPDSSFIKSNRFNAYTGYGQIRDTINILKKQSTLEKINTRLEPEGVKISENEWNDIIQVVGNTILNYNIMMEPLRILPDWVSPEFDEISYYGLRAFLGTFYEVINHRDSFEIFVPVNIDSIILGERLNLLQIMYNSFIYSGAHTLLQGVAAYNVSQGTFTRLSIIRIQIIGDETITSNQWEWNKTILYENITQINATINIVFIYYILYFILGVLMILFNFLVYKKKIYSV